MSLGRDHGTYGSGPAAKNVLGMPKKIHGMPKFRKSLSKCLVTSGATRKQDPHQHMHNDAAARLLSLSADPTTRGIQIMENSGLEPVNSEGVG